MNDDPAEEDVTRSRAGSGLMWPECSHSDVPADLVGTELVLLNLATDSVGYT
jgi:hypothetical protein